MHGVTIKPIMLSVLILNVIMLGIMLNAVLPNVVAPNRPSRPHYDAKKRHLSFLFAKWFLEILNVWLGCHDIR